MSIDSSSPLVFNINSRRFIRIVILSWVAIELLMVWCDYYINYAEWSDISSVQALFNITREDALPAFFGEVQNILVAMTLWLIVIVTRKSGARKFTTIGWTIMAVFFSYLAIDDGSKMHERMGTIFQVSNRGSEGFASTMLDFFPSYTWQLIYIPILVVMGLYIVVFLARELKAWSQRLMIVGALACLTCAVGLDFIEGLDRDHPYNIYSNYTQNVNIENYTRAHFNASGFDTLVHFSKSVEETIEMFAMTLFLAVFLSYLFRLLPVAIDTDISRSRKESFGDPTAPVPA